MSHSTCRKIIKEKRNIFLKSKINKSQNQISCMNHRTNTNPIPDTRIGARDKHSRTNRRSFFGYNLHGGGRFHHWNGVAIQAFEYFLYVHICRATQELRPILAYVVDEEQAQRDEWNDAQEEDVHDANDAGAIWKANRLKYCRDINK